MTGQLENQILESLNPSCDFDRLALELFEFQRQNNPVYAAFAGSAKPAHWSEIPAIPEASFKREVLRCFPVEETLLTLQTSGATRSGIGEHHFKTLTLMETAILNAWRDFSLPIMPRLILIPEARQVPHSHASRLMSTLRKLPGDEKDQIDGFSIEGGMLLDKIIHFLGKHEASGQPIMLLGSTLSYWHLLDRLREKNQRFQLPQGSVCWETGGPKRTNRGELPFEEMLGVSPEWIIHCYSLTEISSQFYASGVEPLYRAPAWTRTVVVHPDTGLICQPGETGWLRVYDLANTGSVFAVQTQELAIGERDGFRLPK